MGSYYAGVLNSDYDSELKHFGILGMKWGVRRFQNEDGTLTAAGKERYYGNSRESQKLKTLINTSPRNLKKIAEHPLIKDAAMALKDDGRKVAQERTKYDKVWDEVDDYVWSNEKVKEKWMNRAIDNFMHDMKIDKSRRNEIYEWYKYDDGDQNEHGTFETFIKESGHPLAKKYSNAEKALATASSDLRKKTDEYANKILGDNANDMDKFWVSYFIGSIAEGYGNANN